MPKFNKILVLLLILFPVFTFAQTGKIVGTVSDKENGEALLGANVLIEGTSFGAATNENGDFVILSVPPGTYTIKARYIGFREVEIQNIKVSVNLTTEVNFELPTESYTTDIVTVVAPKPLIRKNVTNSTAIVDKETIKNLPVRGVNALVSNQAGVVNQGGNIYVRGSRMDAVAYYVDGVLVNNPVFGGSQAAPIQGAIEEVQFQAGGYSAEFGGANGGIISTTTRGGGEKYNFSFDGATDNFPGIEVGDDFLGGYIYGYSLMEFTVSGPVLPGYKNLRFFIAGDNTFKRSPTNFQNEIDFQGVYTPTLTLRDTLSLSYPKGYIVNAASNSYRLSGNLTYEMQPLTLKLSGSLDYNESNNGAGWQNLPMEDRAILSESNTITTSLKVTHAINAQSFYEVIGAFYHDLYISMDPYFKHDVHLYGDSVANAAIKTTSDGYPVYNALSPDGYFESGSTLYGLLVNPTSGWLNNMLYRKQKTQSFEGKANFLYQIGKNHEFKTGGEFKYYTIRRYSLGGANEIALTARTNGDSDPRNVYDGLDNYGYDVFGNEVDDGVYAPKHPVMAAFYIQDKMEYSDLVFNLGFRLDYIDIDSQTPENIHNIQFDSEGFIDESTLKDVDPVMHVSPRLGLSFPVTDRTVFHAQYGKFIQQSRLRDVYIGPNLISNIVKGGLAYSAPVGYGLSPEKTTQYEFGFRQQFGENFAFDITGFYKDIKDQVQIRQHYADQGASHLAYYAYVNGDFATTKGFEVKLDLRRTNRLSGTFNYTFSNALGTGSNSSSSFRTVWQSPTNEPFFPMQISPLDFNRAHSGALNLDYRFTQDDGPELFGQKILSRFGANLLFSFASGFNYTRWEGFGNSRIPQETLNASTTPWTYTIDLRLDKSFEVGPLDMNVYLTITNLLNTKNILGVFNTSGDPYDDGYLNTEEGQAKLASYAQYGEEYAEIYKKFYLADIYDSGHFGTPRQVRVGFRLEY